LISRVVGRDTGAVLALLAASWLSACGTARDTVADETAVSWSIEVATLDEAGFGASIFLNGEEVYAEPGAGRSSHAVGVVRPYLAGENLVEVEIIASIQASAGYVASCTAEVAPTGEVVHADGVPQALKVGERLSLRISL
jgi:hypothetical protein